MTAFLNNEAAFVQLLKQKDRKAFVALYDSYCSALFGEIQRIIKHHEKSEDLLQEVFIQIYQHFDQFDPAKGRLFTWMIAITRNKCLDYLRSASHRFQKQAVMLDENYPAKTNYYFSEKVEFGFIFKQINKYSYKTREIMKLVYVYGLTQEQVARACNLPAGTVKTHIRRTLQNLSQDFCENMPKTASCRED